jgi:hypothetical protein
MKHGKGILIMPDGSKMKGIWNRDRIHGNTEYWTDKKTGNR